MRERKDVSKLSSHAEIKFSEVFSRILLNAIDEGFRVLGEDVSDVVYYYLRNDHGLDRSDIPKKLEVFDEGLKSLFGVGAHIIEREILKKLYAKLELNYKEDNVKSYVDHIRTLYNLYKKRSMPQRFP